MTPVATPAQRDLVEAYVTLAITQQECERSAVRARRQADEAFQRQATAWLACADVPNGIYRFPAHGRLAVVVNHATQQTPSVQEMQT